jgi:crotonobetainyl-CoA:carnitine CoA-transferase CaiB-like acyl-CoA transferase
MSSSSSPGPLAGITIIDFSRVLAGPYATMLLGDLGARVIKIEQPGRGDDTRQWGPPFTADGESAYFLCANRNKESVTLNLKEPAGRAIALEMLTKADVTVENLRVGGMAALGLDYPTVQPLNPALIYCSITGYGQSGPYRHRPGYDAVIQAEGGIMSITGPAADEPGAGRAYKIGVAITDITAGLNAAVAILAALVNRTSTGLGQYIDIALLDCQVSWLANVASAYFVAQTPPQRYGNAHASIVPYQTVQARDGELMLAVGNDGQFAKLCAVLGHPEWATDSRFATNPSRVANRAVLIGLLVAEFVKQPVAAWLARLHAAGVPCGPVNDLPAVFADPQVLARGMVQDICREGAGLVRVVGPAPKLSATPAHVRLPPPRLGEHTTALLHDWLGRPNSEIEDLRRRGVV